MIAGRFLSSSSPRAMSELTLIQTTGLMRRDPARSVALLHPTDFTLNRAERVVVTGPSGSGKSVFLRSLALLDPLDAGEIRWHGRAITRTRIPAYRRRVAYIAQRPAMLDGSVEDNLRYPFSLRVYRDLRFDSAIAARLARQAGRDLDFLDKHASELSGGEAQIAALIRVLQLAPDVLLLDEPTASLDPASALEIEALVAAWFSGAPGRASIWVSHDPQQAGRVGERHLTMNSGVLS
jgi:putative ABC transport system ATP-binding protein